MERRSSLISASSAGPIDLSNPNPNYLTIVALEDGCEIYFYPLDDFFSSADISTLQYSINGSDEWIYCESSPGIVINKDDYVSFKGNLVPIELSIGDTGIGNFNISSLCNLTGNCNSILFGDDAAFNFDLTGYDYCYSYLFGFCPVAEISPTFLPNTTLADRCYEYMFSYCTSLEVAPKLPATTLKSGCYLGMFDGCTSLETAPELPATTLVDSCYQSMFQGCTSLTTAPQLPAKTLVSNCYQFMFSGCSKLNYIKAMFTTSPRSAFTDNWVSGVASSGTFVKNADATWDVTGSSGIPSGWTVVLQSPYDGTWGDGSD